MPDQQDLFANPIAASAGLPTGMRYRPDFVTLDEERGLLEFIDSLELVNARYQQYTARRKTISFGAGYDFTHLTVTQAPAIPPALRWVQDRASSWAGVEPDEFVQVLIAKYEPGTPLGWHRDVPDYELIVGISLVSTARIRFRPYPWRIERRKDIIAIQMAARSAYILSGPSRWEWQHSVPPVKALRYSITMRTRRK